MLELVAEAVPETESADVEDEDMPASEAELEPDDAATLLWLAVL